MIELTPISALKDNYIWLLEKPASRHVAIVDPGDAQPVLDIIERRNLIPIALLITHRHWDHVSGIPAFLQRYPVPVYGPAGEMVPALSHALREDDRVVLPELDAQLKVVDVPGHTRGGIAYYGHGALLCGDTLFTAGCGRMNEGTAQQMHASLSKLAALPPETQVYCGHEYTLANLKFAAVVEPDNIEIETRRLAATQTRQRNLPTVPALLFLEKLTNPFLRCHIPAVITAAERFTGQHLADAAEVFGALRYWKDTLD